MKIKRFKVILQKRQDPISFKDWFNVAIKGILLSIIGVILINLNDNIIAQYIGGEYLQYKFLYIDHLIGAIIMPISWYYIVPISFMGWLLYTFTYLTSYELFQFIRRGYFQFDQFSINILGIVIAIFIFMGIKKRD